jgi:hypothetical protein
VAAVLAHSMRERRQQIRINAYAGAHPLNGLVTHPQAHSRPDRLFSWEMFVYCCSDSGAPVIDDAPLSVARRPRSVCAPVQGGVELAGLAGMQGCCRAGRRRAALEWAGRWCCCSGACSCACCSCTLAGRR